jgi:photosystem II stability/assembly factor-like uncharacterized protein
MAKRISLLVAVVTLVATSLAFASGGEEDFAWQLTPTGSAASFRGLSAVSKRVAWVSSDAGTVLRTTNRGATWDSVGPPSATGLLFRDVETFGKDTAVVLAIGTGSASRIYRTTNGGQTWALVFQNTEPTAFYDCMTFFDRRHGLALSDPIGGEFRILATRDGGRSWQIVDADMPPALPGEFAFAASGQCLVSSGDILESDDDDDDDDRGDRSDRLAWFGTGGDAVARVFRSDDRGRTWTVANTPIRSTPAGGISALAFRDPSHGIAAGGDFTPGAASTDTVALTNDGGATWRLNQNAPDELRSGAVWVTGRDAIIVGPTGSDVSTDRGRSWSRFDSGSFHTVDCAGGDACWAAGTQGRVARLVTDD